MSESKLTQEELSAASGHVKRLAEAMGQMILGQEELIRQTLYCILARGHMLLEGLPGLGKTELVKALSTLVQLQFKRVQFTPDLLPSDITGAPILQESADGGREFVFQQGPLFSNLVLADEINRASPKTQAAMLEAMQERRVTVLGTTHELPDPFFVLATQNPIELEGTYPLPEAQLDRFLMKVTVNRVDTQVLAEIISTRHRGEVPTLQPVLSREELVQLFNVVDRVYLPPAVASYIARLVNSTHPDAEDNPMREYIKFGASPRAAIAIAEASRARAVFEGRPGVGFEDVKAVAPHALNHRILLDYRARLDNVSSETVIQSLLQNVSEAARPLPQGVADA